MPAGPVDLAGQKNCAGTSAEECAAIRGELFEGFEEAFFRQDFEVRAAFAAGENDGGKVREIVRRADERVQHADAVKHFGVGFVVTLDSKNADFHYSKSI